MAVVVYFVFTVMLIIDTLKLINYFSKNKSTLKAIYYLFSIKVIFIKDIYNFYRGFGKEYIVNCGMLLYSTQLNK